MNPAARLAEIVAALEAVGLNGLVMGGHAVRFYGVEAPGSGLHLVLVEAVRRQYKLAARAADKADKEAIRAAQAGRAATLPPAE